MTHGLFRVQCSATIVVVCCLCWTCWTWSAWAVSTCQTSAADQSQRCRWHLSSSFNSAYKLLICPSVHSCQTHLFKSEAYIVCICSCVNLLEATVRIFFARDQWLCAIWIADGTCMSEAHPRSLLRELRLPLANMLFFLKQNEVVFSGCPSVLQKHLGIHCGRSHQIVWNCNLVSCWPTKVKHKCGRQRHRGDRKKISSAGSPGCRVKPAQSCAVFAQWFLIPACCLVLNTIIVFSFGSHLLLVVTMPYCARWAMKLTDAGILAVLNHCCRLQSLCVASIARLSPLLHVCSWMARLLVILCLRFAKQRSQISASKPSWGRWPRRQCLH